MKKKLLFNGDEIDAVNHIKNCKIKGCGICITLKAFLKRIEDERLEDGE